MLKLMLHHTHTQIVCIVCFVLNVVVSTQQSLYRVTCAQFICLSFFCCCHHLFCFFYLVRFILLSVLLLFFRLHSLYTSNQANKRKRKKQERKKNSTNNSKIATNAKIFYLFNRMALLL